jgi:hypothetical protein
MILHFSIEAKGQRWRTATTCSSCTASGWTGAMHNIHAYIVLHTYAHTCTQHTQHGFKFVRDIASTCHPLLPLFATRRMLFTHASAAVLTCIHGCTHVYPRLYSRVSAAVLTCIRCCTHVYPRLYSRVSAAVLTCIHGCTHVYPRLYSRSCCV